MRGGGGDILDTFIEGQRAFKLEGVLGMGVGGDGIGGIGHVVVIVETGGEVWRHGDGVAVEDVDLGTHGRGGVGDGLEHGVCEGREDVVDFG